MRLGQWLPNLAQAKGPLGYWEPYLEYLLFLLWVKVTQTHASAPFWQPNHILPWKSTVPASRCILFTKLSFNMGLVPRSRENTKVRSAIALSWGIWLPPHVMWAWKMWESVPKRRCGDEGLGQPTMAILQVLPCRKHGRSLRKIWEMHSTVRVKTLLAQF